MEKGTREWEENQEQSWKPKEECSGEQDGVTVMLIHGGRGDIAVTMAWVR